MAGAAPARAFRHYCGVLSRPTAASVSPLSFCSLLFLRLLILPSSSPPYSPCLSFCLDLFPYLSVPFFTLLYLFLLYFTLLDVFACQSQTCIPPKLLYKWSRQRMRLRLQSPVQAPTESHCLGRLPTSMTASSQNIESR